MEFRIHSIFLNIVKGVGLSFLLLLIFSACENDVREVNLVSIPDSLPMESIRNMEVVQSEHGKLQFILSSPVLDRFEGKDPYIEFPEGFKIIFYDSLMQVKSELTANWGISWENRKVMEAKNDVVVINHEKNEQLNTEHLIWDQHKKLIYSEVFVKITTEDKTIYGENGMEADEQFDSWKLKKVKGDIIVDQEEY